MYPDYSLYISMLLTVVFGGLVVLFCHLFVEKIYNVPYIKMFTVTVGVGILSILFNHFVLPMIVKNIFIALYSMIENVLSLQALVIRFSSWLPAFIFNTLLSVISFEVLCRWVGIKNSIKKK